MSKTLKQIVAEKPFADYADWWEMGPEFLGFMAEAIVSTWSELSYNQGDLRPVNDYVSEYLQAVYGRAARPLLVEDFAGKNFAYPIQSGEFDALSYAFYRSAFELIEAHLEAYEHPLARERRRFTQRVGQLFFEAVHRHLALDLPAGLSDEQSFAQLKGCIRMVGNFLQTQGYLRDHFDFLFRLDVTHTGRRIEQDESQFISNLQENGVAYALYEMGYPVILPSAVYLYHTIGEAQHHSSRTIEELFALVGYQARETDDFDPTGYPSDRVVELWEIKRSLRDQDQAVVAKF